MPRTADGQPIDGRVDEAGETERGRVAGTTSGSVRAALIENYPIVQYHYVQFLAEHLTDCRKTLGGDFDDLMLLAVLGQRFLAARLARDAGDEGAWSRVWMSALRISDVTGVPRESVRRKLIRLQGRGWVTVNPRLGWRIAGSFDQAVARIDLGDLDARGVDRLARMIAAILPLLSGCTTEGGSPGNP